MDTREIMIKAVHALLSSGSYDDLNEEQNSVVVEFETEIMKEKVDELRKTMPPEEIKETIHDWWQDYEIADGTEDNLLAYMEVNIMYEKVKKIITDNYNLSEKDVEIATQDIVERCFVITGVPKDEELFDYIAEYLDR